VRKTGAAVFDLARAKELGEADVAVEAEVADFLAKHGDLKTGDGHRRVVRHGHLPLREIMTGIGPVAVRQPRVRDREAGADDPERIRFTPAILPPYARRSKSLDTLLPILYLKGVSTGAFEEALAALLGKDAPGLSASAIARLKEGWPGSTNAGRNGFSPPGAASMSGQTASICRRGSRTRSSASLSLLARHPRARRSWLASRTGRARAPTTGASCSSILKRRGLSIAPELAVADGALGFWKALGEIWPARANSAAGFHKTANVLNKLPKSQQPKAKTRAAGDLDGRDEERCRGLIRRVHPDL